MKTRVVEEWGRECHSKVYVVEVEETSYRLRLWGRLEPVQWWRREKILMSPEEAHKLAKDMAGCAPGTVLGEYP